MLVAPTTVWHTWLVSRGFKGAVRVNAKLKTCKHTHTNPHANCCQCWIWPRVLWERGKWGKHTFRVWWTCHPGRRWNNLLFHLVHSAGCLLLHSGCCHPAGNESVYWARPSICTAAGCAIMASGAVNVTSVGPCEVQAFHLWVWGCIDSNYMIRFTYGASHRPRKHMFLWQPDRDLVFEASLNNTQGFASPRETNLSSASMLMS